MAIYRRGNIFWYDFTFKGKRYRDSTHAANKRVAEQVVAGFKAALAKGEVGIIEKKPAPIFSAFWKQALDEIKGDTPEGSRTTGWYQTHFEKCLSFSPLAKARLDSIDEELLSKLRQHLVEKQKLSAPTVNGRFRAIRRALYIALAWRKINRVPDFPMMSEKGHSREFILTPVLKTEFLGKSPEKFRVIFEFLLETGLRISECVQLTWDRVFLDKLGPFGRPYVYIRTDREREVTIKSKRNRYVPLFDRALEIIMFQQRISRADFVFVQHGARVKNEKQFLGRFSRHDVSRAFRRVARSMGLPKDAVLHSTRHTMLTELGTAGADASTIQMIAGHEDIRTSQKYLHPTPQHVLMAFERMHKMRQLTEERTEEEVKGAGSRGRKWEIPPTISPTVTKQQLENIGKMLKMNHARVAELADAPDLGSGG